MSEHEDDVLKEHSVPARPSERSVDEPPHEAIPLRQVLTIDESLYGDDNDDVQAIGPLEGAKWYLRYSWYWLKHVVEAGSKSALQIDDLPKVASVDSGTYLFRNAQAAAAATEPTEGNDGDEMKELLKADGEVRIRNLYPLLQKLFLKKYALNGFIELTFNLLQVASALLLKQLITFVGDSSQPLYAGILYALGMGLSGMLQGVLHHVYFFGANRVGAQMRTVLNIIIFQKLLRLKSSALVETTTGQIVNLVSNDSFKLEFAASFVYFIVGAPIIGAIVVTILILEIGVSAIPGCIFVFLMVPLQTYFSQKFASVRKITIGFTDHRVKTVKEILVGSQIVKMYNWEKPLEKSVSYFREREVKSLTNAAGMKAINQGIFFVSLTLVSVISFSTHVALGNTLSPGSIFSAVYLFAVLQFPFTAFFPQGVEGASESKIAVDRMNRFLNLPEVAKNRAESENLQDTDDDVVSEFKNADFSWSPDGEIVLKDVNVQFKKGELTVVIGQVGASKTSLLMALLGEMTKVKGSVRVPKKVAYASQKPWIFAGTVKENIVFHREFDLDRYKWVIEACELVQDIQNLPELDETVIGERGVNLSGGQKARVSLARACYGIADLYLLDDPLSAVDAVVASRIINNCIGSKDGTLLSGSTRVLVTHQTQFLDHANQVLCLEKGVVLFQGPPNELKSRKDEFSGFTEILSEDIGEVKENIEEGGKKKAIIALENVNFRSTKTLGEGIFEKEDRQEGAVGFGLYKHLVKAIGEPFVVVFFFVVAIACQLCVVASDYWLSRWSNEPVAEQPDTVNYIVYASLGGAALVFSMTRTQIFFRLMLRAAVRLHNGMFKGVLYSPMRFFESNPVGRVLNRFTKDQSAVDEFLPLSLWDVVQLGVLLVAIIIVIALTNPFALISLVVIIPVFFYVRRRYVASSREIKRLDGVTKSPVLAFFSSTLDGIATVRAYGMEDKFMANFIKKIDRNNRAWFSFLYLSRWLGFRLDMSSSLMVLAASLAAVLTRSSINPSLAAFSLLYVLRLTSMFQWVVRQSAEVENYMTSLERIHTYSQLPSEGELVIEGSRPGESWPQKGAIEVSNFKMRYRPELDLVLKGLEFKVKPGEKVGVCGRTGAGKSSLFSAFYRLVNKDDGHIKIDDVDINSIGLNDLRSKLSIIPQEPVIFSGSIRYNLDPFSIYSDEDIWTALEIVQLKETVERLPEGLQTVVAEFGGNFSSGEGQLICVARALLKPSKVLFVDEGKPVSPFLSFDKSFFLFSNCQRGQGN
jgi:ATP-binding cassette subfamily C (CFTR/MRP) protein 4